MNNVKYSVALCLVYGAVGVGGLILFHAINGNAWGAVAAIMSAGAAYAASNFLILGKDQMYSALSYASLAFAAASLLLMVV